MGILKAYTTRVGAGPFPTELSDAQGEWLRKTGSEYGTTTGGPRRTGWLDTVIARYATRVNGLTDYFITKLDILSGLEKVPVCVAYDVHGKRHDEIPMTQTDFHHAVPVYGVPGRLVGGHLAGQGVLGPAEERTGLRARRRGPDRRAGRCRCRPAA